MGNKEGWTDFKLKSADSGVATHVYAAFEPGLSSKWSINYLFMRVKMTGAGNNGVYLQDCHIADPWTDTVKPWATSSIDAEKLWVLSEKLVWETFKY